MNALTTLSRIRFCAFYTFLALLIFVPISNLKAQHIKTVSGKKITISKLAKKIKTSMKKLQMPGLSIAIINHNKVVYHNTFGVVKSGSNSAVNKHSIFEGASLSKPIFAYFAMKMVEKGVLNLDKPLYTYLPHPGIDPASQEDYKLITPRMVLSHSTGFPNHSNNQPIKLAFKPGTGLAYSGEAYQYLAAIIGQLHGVGWKDGLNNLFKAHVTQPLKMVHSSFLWNDYLAQHKVYGHNAKGEPTDNDTGAWSGKTFNAFSSIHSQAEEYSRFILAMLKQEGLSKEGFKEMLSPQNPFAKTEKMFIETGQTAWGLGFAQKPTPNGLMHLHTGNNHDFQAYAMFVPKQQYGLVAFTNCDKMLPFLKEISTILEEQF